MAALFDLDRVSVTAPDGTVMLAEATVAIASSGITCIVGPSGAGKSTMLRLLNRLEVPSVGTITYCGRPIEELDVTDLRRRVAMLFQRAPVFPGTAMDSLRIARPDLDRATAESLMGRAALDPVVLDQDAATLSGGEAQRLSLARALVNDPEVLLADEPTASLDHAARDALEAQARSLCDGGVPIVWITHDTDQLRRLADRVIVLGGAGVLASGPLAEVQASTDERVRRLVGVAS